MKILIIGSGGREHALAWKIRQSSRVSEVISIPGNGGTPVHSVKADSLDQLRDFALGEKIDLTVVGPDDALAGGIVDRFREAGLRIFGPTQAAARLESSKIFAKDFMVRHGIATARAGAFFDAKAALEFVREVGFPVVIKADGLALGKGVIIAENEAEAGDALHRMLELREFGASGAAVVVEEYLQGEECSIHALVDGRSHLLFPGAQDHKRAFDGDNGPNTGGMGSCSPVPRLDAAMQESIRRDVLDRFVAGCAADGIDFQGMLFPGLMLTREGPKVLEFNCRFGDPETQVLLPRLRSDLVDLLEATIDRRLHEMQPQWDARAAVCVVLASGGYPGRYPTGLPITGLEEAVAEDALIFHAGTKRSIESLLTNGGRVLGVTALGDTVQNARAKAYRAAEKIHFDGQFCRRDIGSKSL